MKQASTETLYYTETDNLGSIIGLKINSDSTYYVERYSYDAWGRLRNLSTRENYTPGSEPALLVASRSFTGHEHSPWFNLVNMNGRVYDPILGRFLSPDNFVREPDNTQNFNRYSYCLNYPLAYTDPTGFGWEDVPEGHLWDIVKHRNLTYRI